MALDWHDLKVFLAMERGKSARAAAASLGSSHSTVLRRLQALEAALGARVFDRTPDGLAITGAGERLLTKAQQIEADVLEVERDVAQSDIVLKGPVRLTAPPAVLKYLLLPALSQFRADYPDITLDVIATDGFSDLGRRDADIAIRFAANPDEYLVGRTLPPFHDAIYVAADHSGGPDTGHQDGWIAWTAEQRFQDRIARTPFAASPIGWRLPGLELQAEAARQGLGMALLPCIMGDTDPALKRLAPAFTQPTLPAWLLRHPDLRRLERVRVFAQFLSDKISEQRDFVAGVLGEG
ncbi:LysR family transcriptional regulator [Jannaschia sp. CCS1]|uniref:LysR family transcriptional regulator n=1 Tax=Jannaschia sp. (strain CCS1) TaxID=290400 RepID=UPI000053A43C|nr:LysR family transcriptional regulator [Jannaschia sp. CCS1]ABD53639.1 transcriptional regulator, LysR family [Jannaschia sp. CCS1]